MSGVGGTGVVASSKCNVASLVTCFVDTEYDSMFQAHVSVSVHWACCLSGSPNLGDARCRYRNSPA